MTNRSLTQAEAEAARRAARRRAVRHRRRPHRPARRARGPVHVDGDVHVPPSRARRRFVDCAARGASAPRSTATPLPPAADGRHRADRPGGRQRARRGDRAGATPATARACTGPSTRPTARSTSGRRSSRTRRGYVWACFDQPDLKAPHALHGHRAGARGPWSATPATRRSTTVDGGRTLDVPRHAAAVDVQPGRQRRPVPRDPPRGRTATTSACSRRRSLAPILERDAEELFTLTAQGLAFFGERVRDAVPAAQVRPGVRARVRRRDGELRLRHVVRRRSCAGTTPTAGRAGAAAPRCCCTRWRTCGSATSSRCAGGTTSGSTRRSPSSPATGRPSGATEFTDAWAELPRRREARRLPRRPGPDPPPDPPARPRRRGAPRRSSTPSPTPRAPRCCKQLMPYVGEDDVRGGHDAPTSPSTPGATPPSTTSSTRSPRPAAGT